MCSIDNNEDSFMTVEERLSLDETTLCRRCKAITASVMLKRKDAYCRECFLSYVTHKFRAALGKSKLMRPSDKVLVAFSGGPSSVALLHMLWAGTQEEDHKKLLYKVSFCYIDDGAVLGNNIQERREMLNQNKIKVEAYGFEFHATSLSRGMADDGAVFDESHIESLDDSALQSLFQGLNSLTAKEDLLLKLRQRLLVSVARRLQCNKIFTAEGQTGLAVKLLTSVALGRGEQLSLEVGFEDSRYTGVLILRPMRDVEKKEVAYYNQCHGLESLNRPSLSTGMSTTASIRRLTQEFVNGLQEEFPSTVSTIFRTGEKLCMANNGQMDLDDKCLLCHGNALISPDTEGCYGAVDATAYSRVVSRPSAHAPPSVENGCCGDCSCSISSYFSDEQLQNCFCYGCLLIIREMMSMNLLPTDIVSEISRRNSLRSMRQQIADFLL